jgi:uncharacterized protein (DUF1697 family)
VQNYVALLRGINLGARNKIAMPELTRLFVDLGYADVTTYIQSGNVVFKADKALPADIEQSIADKLGLDVAVLLRTKDELAALAAANPFLGRNTDLTKLHATFLAGAAGGELSVPTGETAECALGDQVVYLYCPDGYGRTRLNNAFIERRLGVVATTRNWRTVTKLCELAS